MTVSNIYFTINNINTIENCITSTLNEVKRIIESDKEPNIYKKRELYNSAFKILRNDACGMGNYLPLQKALFELFEVYVGKTCYAQAGQDEEEGFRKSARLMEFAFCMQLQTLDLVSFPNLEWTGFNDLEELIQNLEIQKDQEGMFFPVIKQLIIDSKVLAEKAAEKGLREVVAKTLIRMTYSHQNISALKNPKGPDEHVLLYIFHNHYNSLTEELIGSENIEQQRELVGYRYNRCGFLAGLQRPGDWKAKFASYDPVIESIKKFYPKGDFDGNSKIAQIMNMQGLIICRSNPEAMQEARQLSYPYFEKAFEIRQQLVEACVDEEKRLEQKFLLSNIRTALIDNLVNRDPLSEEDKSKIFMHAAELEKFIQDSHTNGNYHAYQSSYQAAIDKTKRIV